MVCSYRYTLPTVSTTKCSMCDNVTDMLLCDVIYSGSNAKSLKCCKKNTCKTSIFLERQLGPSKSHLANTVICKFCKYFLARSCIKSSKP